MAFIKTASSQNVISGKVILKESNLGIPDLLVAIYDLDPNARPEETFGQPSTSTLTVLTSIVPFLGDRIGSVITSKDGSFSIGYDDSEYRISNTEKRPDLYLMVLAPEEPGSNPVVLFSTVALRQNAGRLESYIIRISGDALTKAGIAPPDKKDLPVEKKIENYQTENDERMRISRGISGYNKKIIEADVKDKKAFRKEFVKKIATDFSVAGIKGQLVKDGENIKDKNTVVTNNTIAKANDVIISSDGVPVNLYLSPSDQDKLANYFLPQNLVNGMAVIPADEIQDLLFRTNSSENPGTILINNNPIAKFCANDTLSETCAKIQTDLMTDGNNGSAQPPVVTTNNNGSISNEDLPKYIKKIIDTMPVPESIFDTDPGAIPPDEKAVQKNVNKFSLNMGPADVPAYYEFQVLQIAFEYVWKQLLDSDIINAAQEINSAVKSKFGLGLLQLLENGTFNLGGYFLTPQVLEVPPLIVSYFDITKQEYNDLSEDLRNQLKFITTTLNAMVLQIPVLKDNDFRLIEELREQGDRIVESVRQNNFNSLQKTLQDLQEKLKSKYEYTVFAADKNFHSVNFGILNTYQQEWVPINYQVGKLIKTIPLTPKEERKYSTKVNRTEKRTVKEARKNSSSIVSEQSSTSRVEADIIQKAMNKTNFNLSTEGDYDIYISSGTAKTSFGIDAQTESSQNRKDIRESVLKATQDYKDERTIEINTEDSTSYEMSTSGTIVNPNSELAVTYLFYELQRRYRISEQLYRVMPVVLVAQEVPSPDEITEAWVLSNDWIINRCLLDDSYRSTLEYLATKSVGDDFAVRELRKNLRQQRNLVETLKNALTAANEEASSRYKALEKAIEDRINEQISSDNEGFFTNLAAFFGKDDADPEAAKARELAAKDAQQYAAEKAAQAASALKEEINNLKALTDEYNQALENFLDNETKVKRLLVHIKNNILYYMQEIWKMEPPDQRFLRLNKVQVPVLELDKINDPAGSGNQAEKYYFVDPHVADDIFKQFREKETDSNGNVLRYTEKHKAFVKCKLKPLSDLAEPYKPLVEVADLDTLIGFKGNYLIFPLKEHNALTELMASPYVDNAFGAMDPDELSNINLNDFSKYVCCLQKNSTKDEFEALKPSLKEWLKQLLADPLRNGDEITVPTDSLYIEALLASEPLLEEFQMKHRKLDVLKVLEEVRKAGMENLRLAARLLNSKLEDPDIEKKVIVEGSNGNTDIDVDS